MSVKKLILHKKVFKINLIEQNFYRYAIELHINVLKYLKSKRFFYTPKILKISFVIKLSLHAANTKVFFLINFKTSFQNIIYMFHIKMGFLVFLVYNWKQCSKLKDSFIGFSIKNCFHLCSIIINPNELYTAEIITTDNKNIIVTNNIFSLLLQNIGQLKWQSILQYQVFLKFKLL